MALPILLPLLPVVLEGNTGPLSRGVKQIEHKVLSAAFRIVQALQAQLPSCGSLDGCEVAAALSVWTGGIC